MFKGIDHFVIVVPELEAAIRDYTTAGFAVVRGGRHTIGSHNALIALADGAYIELIAFLESAGGHPWYATLEKGGGLVDFCMQTDDLQADAQAMRQAGVPMSAANPMTRDRPDGFRVSWVPRHHSSGRTLTARGHGSPSGRTRSSWSPRKARRVPWSIGSSCAGNLLLA